MFTSLESAKRHLRIDGDADDAELAEKIAAAEQIACEYLNRKVFADQAGMDAAVALVPAAILAAGVDYEAADTAADMIGDRVACLAEKAYAFNRYSAALRECAAIRNGIVISPMILAAMALILGDLWEFRENTVAGVSVSGITDPSRVILDPLRIGPGL